MTNGSGALCGCIGILYRFELWINELGGSLLEKVSVWGSRFILMASDGRGGKTRSVS